MKTQRIETTLGDLLAALQDTVRNDAQVVALMCLLSQSGRLRRGQTSEALHQAA